MFPKRIYGEKEMIPGVNFVRFINDRGKLGTGTRVTLANGVRVTFTSHVPKGLALRLAFGMFAPRPKPQTETSPCSPP